MQLDFFCSAILLAFRSVVRNSLCYAAYAGLCLALSAYFRSQFEFILLSLTGWGILLVIALQLTRLQKYIRAEVCKISSKNNCESCSCCPRGDCALESLSLEIPGKPFLGVIHLTLLLETQWQLQSYLKNNSGGFVVDGGGNLVCRIDPTTCGDTANAKNLFVETFHCASCPMVFA